MIISLAEREIPLWGGVTGAKKRRKRIAFILKWKSQDNAELASFLKNAPRNAQIQNQLMLSWICNRETIVQEANKARFLSIMADETCDVSTTEQMAVAIRYLKTNDGGSAEVTEDFLGFIQLTLSVEFLNF